MNDVYLTSTERQAMEVTCSLSALLGEITGNGRTRNADLYELTGHIHAIQQAILSQAAARAYPDEYRLLGQDHPAGTP